MSQNPATESTSDSDSSIGDIFSGMPDDRESSEPAQQETTPQAPTDKPVAAPVTTQPSTPVQPEVVPPPVNSSLQLSPAQLAEIVKAVAPGTPSPVKSESPHQTPEEIDKFYNVVRPSEDHINKLFRGGPEAVQTMTELLHAGAKQGATMAVRHMLGEQEKLVGWVRDQLQALAPARQMSEEAQVKSHTEAFFSSNPQFNESHGPVLKAVYDNLLARGFKGSPQEVYTKIAEEATNLIRTVDPQFGATQPTGQPGQRPAATPQGRVTKPALPPSKMTPLPHGGAGSSGAAPGASPGGRSGPAALFE